MRGFRVELPERLWEITHVDGCRQGLPSVTPLFLYSELVPNLLRLLPGIRASARIPGPSRIGLTV